MCFCLFALSHSHTESYDWLRLGKVRPIGNVCTISSSGRIRRSIFKRGRAITNDWRISMERAIVGNRATSRSVNDRCTINRDGRRPINRSLHPNTYRTSNCDILRPIVRALLASCRRAYDQLWHPRTDGTITREVQRSVARSIVA